MKYKSWEEFKKAMEEEGYEVVQRWLGLKTNCRQEYYVTIVDKEGHSFVTTYEERDEDCCRVLGCN